MPDCQWTRDGDADDDKDAKHKRKGNSLLLAVSPGLMDMNG